jgi:hypothetical protein
MRAAGTGAQRGDDLHGAWYPTCRYHNPSLQIERFDNLLKALAHCLLLEASSLRKQQTDTLSYDFLAA